MDVPSGRKATATEKGRTMKTNDEIVADKHPIFKRTLEAARRQAADDERVSSTIEARVRAAQAKEGGRRKRRSGVERD